MNVQDLTANVKTPIGRVDDAQIIETEDSNYSIRFIPKVILRNIHFRSCLTNYSRRPESIL